MTVHQLGVGHGDELLLPVRFFTLTDGFWANLVSRLERSFASIYDRLAAVANIGLGKLATPHSTAKILFANTFDCICGNIVICGVHNITSRRAALKGMINGHYQAKDEDARAACIH